MRRSLPLILVLGIAFTACATSSTPDLGNGTGGGPSDAATGDEAPSYGDDGGTTTPDDAGSTPTDAGRKEGGLPIYDAGSTPDTGSGSTNMCDDSGGTYSLEYLAAAFAGLTLGPCSAGCKPTECCFDPGAGDPVCLTQ